MKGGWGSSRGQAHNGVNCRARSCTADNQDLSAEPASFML